MQQIRNRNRELLYIPFSNFVKLFDYTIDGSIEKPHNARRISTTGIHSALLHTSTCPDRPEIKLEHEGT